MNGIHDMGGMHGFGQVPHEGESEPVFHEPWEGRLYGMVGGAAPVVRPSSFRFMLESLHPAVYLGSSYYGRWIEGITKRLVDEGIVTEEELNQRIESLRGHPDSEMPRHEDPEFTAKLLATRSALQPLHRDVGIVPKFQSGDHVTTRNAHPEGHTRIPRYVRGKHGSIDRCFGVHEFQDTDVDGNRLSDVPQPLYSVRFEARELWGEAAETNENLYIDLWESYLEAE